MMLVKQALAYRLHDDQETYGLTDAELAQIVEEFAADMREALIQCREAKR
jgi:hypothetical protein